MTAAPPLPNKFYTFHSNNLIQRLPAAFQFFHHIRQGFIFHGRHGQPVRLKRIVPAQKIRKRIGFFPGPVKSRVIKHIPGADEVTRGGRSNRLGVASCTGTGIKGP